MPTEQTKGDWQIDWNAVGGVVVGILLVGLAVLVIGAAAILVQYAAYHAGVHF